MKFNVPTIDSPDAAERLQQVILTSEPEAKIEIDREAKTVVINSKASEATFKQLIVAAGHEVN